MLIVKVIICFLLLILHKMSYIFAKQFLNQFRTGPVTVPKLMLILKVIIWFLLLISHKMSVTNFHDGVLEPVTAQVLLLFRNLC